MGFSKKVRRRKRLKRLRRFLLIVVGTLFVGWIFYVGATWGPRPVDSEPLREAQMVDRSLVEESERLAHDFEAIAAQRDPSDKDLKLLRDALARQRQYNLASSPTLEDRRRQEELERRLAHFEAKEVHSESLAAEQEAKRLLEEGKVIDAMAKTQEAFNLQREINQHYSRTSFRNPAREGTLEQQLASLEAEPLHRRSVELEEKADEAIEDFRWEEARTLLTEARNLQNQVNEIARRSSYHNPGRHQGLGEKLASLLVGEKMSEILSLQKEAQALEKKGEWERAAQLFEQAMVLQNEINRDHPQSEFVSTERVTELNIARQTALSARQANQLKTVLAEMRQALAAEEFAVARKKIEAAGPLITQLFDRFPESRHADFNMRLEIDYLDLVQESLPELQKLLRADLLPVPGEGGWQMSKTLVSQKVFSRVMNANPSRNRGDDLPVDSVTLSQAREFCRRASWILARPVQLPERAHFEAALGEWKPEAYAPLSWHKENSGGESHAVTTKAPNPHGFFHLVGNLRLWLGETTEDGAVWIAGSSYAEEFPPEKLFQVVERNERDQTIGFRYLVGTAAR